MYYLDLLKDISGREDIVAEVITDYFNMHLFANPVLVFKGVVRGEYVFDVRDPRIIIGSMSELHVRDFNFYFDNQLEEENIINHNKLWIAIMYNKLKELSPAFAEEYMKRAIARNEDILDYIKLSRIQKIEIKYDNMIKRLTEQKKEELEAVDKMIISNKQEFNGIFSEKSEDDKTL